MEPKKNPKANVGRNTSIIIPNTIAKTTATNIARFFSILNVKKSVVKHNVVSKAYARK